jgi:hypothetical protein
MSELQSVDLRSFIAATLQDIADGVRDANKKLESIGASASPIRPRAIGKADRGYFVDGNGRMVISVEISARVNVEESTNKNAGFGVTVASLFKSELGGAKLAKEDSSGTVSCVLPLVLPLGFSEE